MIAIRVRDVRGCERADIVCDPLALVAGRNAAGKSSIVQAVGAALTGRALMIENVGKGSAGVLVRTGASGAFVEIKFDDESGTARVEWPACQATAEGDPPHASIWAAGLDSVALLAPRERAQILAGYLHADPTREDLAAALADVGLGEERVIKIIWDLVEAQGWDGAHEKRRETGAELKGAWRHVTGANWGARVAQTWRPGGWSQDLEEAAENDLLAAVAAAKGAHEAAIGAAAVSGAQREGLEHEADTIEERKDRLADAEIEETRLETDLEKLRGTRAALPPGGADAEMPCPHCGGLVVLRQIDLATRRLEAAETVAPNELKQRRLAIADTDGAIGRVSGQLAEQRRAVERARDAMQLAADARHRLSQIPADAPQVDVAGAEAKVRDAEARVQAWRAKRQADDLRDRVNGNDLVLKILAADGLRAQKLGRVLEVFNRTLEPLSDAAEWAAVTVDPAMLLAYGGRPYALLSTSEQYRVRAVLQCAMAQLDDSDMIVLDAADVLDGATRSGLFGMMEESGLAGLVCMTLTRREQVPDLAAAELGQSYWIEGGLAAPLRQMTEAAA
jgi:hypothetical protein